MTQLTLTGVGVTLHRRQLLADVSLAWPEAKLGGIIGPNGAGKSTLLKAINRMLPHSGAIAYRERTLDPKTSRIAYVPQLNRGESALTAFDMVLLGKVRQLGWRVSAAQADAVEQALAECGISALADRPFNRLSGGQRQLVMLAQAFVSQPQLILLDEPTSALDIHHQLRVLNQIADYSRRHRCITLLVIHDLGLALRYCHSLTLLEHGRVICHGDTHQMMGHPMMSRVFGVGIESGISPKATPSAADTAVTRTRRNPMYTLTKADMLAQLAGLQQEIHQLHRSARQDRRHFSLLERRFSRLQAFNDLPQLQAYRRKLENDRSITAQITQLRAVANAALCDYEKHRVATLCREPAQTNAYLNNFDSALQLEIAAADIKPGERVLLVGSGALPTTALALVARLSATVICYDCDPAAQRFARRLTRHLGLSRQILCIDKLNGLTDRDIDHIIIASLVADKQNLADAAAAFTASARQTAAALR